MKEAGIWQDKKTQVQYYAWVDNNDGEQWKGEQACIITVPLKLHSLMQDERDSSGIWDRKSFEAKFVLVKK